MTELEKLRTENERLKGERDDSRETFENIIAEFKAAVDKGVELVYGSWPKGMCLPQSMGDFVDVIARYANELMRDRDTLTTRLATAEGEVGRLRGLPQAIEDFYHEVKENWGGVKTREEFKRFAMHIIHGIVRPALTRAALSRDGGEEKGSTPDALPPPPACTDDCGSEGTPTERGCDECDMREEWLPTREVGDD